MSGLPNWRETMNHWLLDNITEKRELALNIVDRIQANENTLTQNVDTSTLSNVFFALELTVLDLILDKFEEDDDKLKLMRYCAADAFRIISILPLPENTMHSFYQLLKMSSLAVLGDQRADASRILKQIEWPDLNLCSENWRNYTWTIVMDAWLRLFCEKNAENIEIVLRRISELRLRQKQYEKAYFDSVDAAHAKSEALELIGLYHLAKAAEILALFIVNGDVDKGFQTRQLLETHFDKVLDVCKHGWMNDLETITRLLYASSLQIVNKTN